MCDRVAPHIEPTTAACAVNPALCKPTLWVGTDEQVLAPFFIADLIAIFWVGNASFRTVMEFGFVTWTAPWAWNV